MTNLSNYRAARLVPFALLALATGALAAPPRPAEVANPEITAAEIKAHIRYLASDELQGRRSGSPGNDLASSYIAARFRAAGLKPLGDGASYYQKFPVFVGAKLGKENRLWTRTEKGTETLDLGQDYMPLIFTGNGQVEGEVVFAGYGISRPDINYDDYKDLDVKGKIVLVLRHTPDGDDSGKFGPNALLTYKTMTAREKGAAGILLVTGPLSDKTEDHLGVKENGKPLPPQAAFRRAYRTVSASSDCGIPAAIVKTDWAEKLAGLAGKNLKDLQVGMAHGKPASFPIPGAQVTFQTGVIRETGATRNVVGFLEGSDPRLKEEVVVLGAHYDHLGLGDEHSLSESDRPEIHHGADDNASGTAAILELAQYFAANRKKLGRSLLFMAFSGEEMGLLGSAHWVKEPTIPLGRVAAMVNLDMVGRMKGDTVQVIGAGSSPVWQGLLDQANKPFKLQVKTGGKDSSGFGGSDQQSFYAKNIPVLFFFTGVHPDYHKPSDTWDKINSEGEAKVTQLVAETVREISWLKARPQFARSKDSEPSSGPGFNVYLGTIPDYAEEVEGVALQGVREGSPAEKGGLRAGDVIVEFDGKKIRNVQEYTVVLSAAKAGVPIQIVVLRKGERVPLTVTPAARRG